MISIKEIVINFKKFKGELQKACSDVWSGEKKILAITLDRVIEVCFKCLIKNTGPWSYLDPFEVLTQKIYKAGFKELPKYRSEKELHQRLCDFNCYNMLSGSEKKVFDAISKVDAELRWKIYLAINKFIDNFLRYEV